MAKPPAAKDFESGIWIGPLIFPYMGFPAFFAAKPAITQLTKQWRRLEGGLCPPEPRGQAPESGRTRAVLACLHPVIRLSSGGGPKTSAFACSLRELRGRKNSR